MFLSTMTADAASQHGHEFSNSRATSLFPIANFPRSTINALLSVATRQNNPPPLKDTEFNSNEQVNPAIGQSKQHMSLNASTGHSRPTTSSSAESVIEIRSKKKGPRSKTTYNLCHPPPKARRQKIRPRVLLQLQQISQSARPRPAFDVTPSLRCAPKLLSKFSRVFRAVDRLGPEDIVVLKAAEYGKTGDVESSDEDAVESSEAIGVIFVDTKKEDKQSMTTQICLDDGSVWHAIPKANGSYEFVTTDAHGLQHTARWVARSTNRRKASSLDVRSINGGVTGGLGEEKKFTFSTIRPDCRRHPIIASMTRTNIEIMDEYTMPPTLAEKNVAGFSAANSPVATPSACSESESYMESRRTESTPIKTDEALQKLILLTGIWVAFRENWSTAFSYGNIPHSPSPLDLQRPFAPQRTVSMPVVDSKIMSRSGTPDSEGRRTMQRMFRNSSTKLKRSSASSIFSPPSIPSSPPSSPETSARRKARRTKSTDITQMRSSTHWHQLQTEAFSRNTGLVESPMEIQEPFDSTVNISEQNSGKANAPPILITSTSDASLRSLSGSERSANVSSPVRTDRVHVQSAYLPPESTKGLWDSGNTEVTSNGKKSKKVRPKSYGDLPESANSKSEKRKSGRIRKILGFFRLSR